MQPGRGGREEEEEEKEEEGKYRAEMQSGTQMATFQLTELRVWVREGAGQARTP